MRILVFLLMFLTQSAFAINVQVSRRDMKLATQVLLERQTVTNPVVADPDRILNDQVTSSSSTTTVTSFLAQPDVCRTLTITPVATTADVNAGTTVITGKNFYGQTITEGFGISENQTTVTTGSKAFCTVTSILFHQQDGNGAQFDVGVSDRLGLKRCMDAAGYVVFATLDGVYETTRPTCVADADEVEKNYCDINGTLTGSKNVDLFFIQNFRCGP